MVLSFSIVQPPRVGHINLEATSLGSFCSDDVELAGIVGSQPFTSSPAGANGFALGVVSLSP